MLPNLHESSQQGLLVGKALCFHPFKGEIAKPKHICVLAHSQRNGNDAFGWRLHRRESADTRSLNIQIRHTQTGEIVLHIVWKLFIQVLIYKPCVAVHLKVADILVLVNEFTSVVHAFKVYGFHGVAVDGCQPCGLFRLDIQRWAKRNGFVYTTPVSPSAIQHILATKINACIEVHYLSTIAIQS